MSNQVKKILIIHGWGSEAKKWQKVKEELEKAGFEVFIPDLPGFDITPPPPQVWGAKEYSFWVKDYIKNKISDKFILIGHSFGGAIALNLLSQMPEKVEKLILCAPAILRTRKRKTTLTKKIVKTLRKFIKWHTPKSIQRALSKFLGNYDYYKAKGIMKEVFKKVIQEKWAHLLKEINCPTLLIWGEQDKLVPPKEGEILKKMMKNSELIVLKDVGHNPYLDCPETLAQKIIEFVKSNL